MYQDQQIRIFQVVELSTHGQTQPGGANPKTDGTIATFKVRAKTAGTASFSVSGDFYDPDENPVKPSFSGTSVTIKEKETPPPVTEQPTPTPTPTPTPPTTGGSTGGSTTNKPSGGNTGSSTTKPSGGTTSGGSTTTTSSNANLKELHLSVEGLSPAFQKTITRYNLIVGGDVSTISVNAIPEEADAKVNVTGNTNLQIGVNEIRISVTAPDGKTVKNYSIEVTKTENPDLANANLENLAIENVTLEPEFSQDVLSYTAIINSHIETINLLAIPQIEGATVQVTGADNLQFGENNITIKVIAKDGVTSKEYTIMLYKTTEEEENKEIMPRGGEQEEQKETEHTISPGQIVFCVIITGSTLGASYMLIRKYRKEK